MMNLASHPSTALERNRAKPTQRNEPIISEAIFGVGVSVVEIAPRQHFSASYAKVPTIAAEVYKNYRPDGKQLDRVLAREELSYYATAQLWFKLLSVKAKQGDTVLTSKEKDICKAIADDNFNVPEPLYTYLQEVGMYKDKMGKEMKHNVPPLPETVVQGFGGYHAAEINAETHNAFEEIPSLGIAGDMLMALSSDDPEPEPNFRVAVPRGSEMSENLVGRFFLIGPRRPEVRQRLLAHRITPVTFHEYVQGTRFNLGYVRELSDIIGQFETFKVGKVCYQNLTASGGETQVILTKPTDHEENQTWLRRTVQSSSSAASSKGYKGASFMFGFQLYKEDGPGESATMRAQNWCCLKPDSSDNPWKIPHQWIENRNQRRDVPEDVGRECFHTISMRQDLQTEKIIRRMIKTEKYFR